MNLDKLIVMIFGIAGMIFTYWYFFMKKEHVVEAGNTIDIVVDGGYNPDTIAIPYGKTTTINFYRKDPSTCLEEVVISDFKIRKYLPLNQKVSIEITPKKQGEFQFVCGMNMFHGKLVVK